MLRAAFAVLEAGRLVNLKGIRFPRLTRLRYGTPIPIQNGQGQLVAVDIVKGAPVAGATLRAFSAKVFHA